MKAEATRQLVRAALLVTLTCTTSAANAVMPVVDVAAIRQLLQQVSAWREQLRGMQAQLSQLRQSYAAVTGPRGMERLLPLPIAARNYLPADWTTVIAARDGVATGYGELTSTVRQQVMANSVLLPSDLDRMSGPLRLLLEDERRAVAGSEALTRLAYRRSSERFAALATLIDKIGATPDTKAIAELQGRIEAEQAMLANEAVKMAALADIGSAESAALDLRRREQVVANHGAFAARFQPTPPAP